MTESTVVFLPSAEGVEDPLTEVLRTGARQLVKHAVEAEVAALLAAYADHRTETGRRRLVRHGHGPEREILTGIGAVSGAAAESTGPRKRGGGSDPFSSTILPRFARRTRSLDAALPTLYLLGVSSGDFGEALSELVGPGASGLSPGVIGRLKSAWEAEHERWRLRDLSRRRYVYVWADGIYLQGRLEDEKQRVLVLIGATPEGRKELLGFQAGFRESAESWRELLEDLKGRGLTVRPELAIVDGALGFWKALDEVFPETRRQRCWVHKTANALNALPKSRQRNPKLHRPRGGDHGNRRRFPRCRGVGQRLSHTAGRPTDRHRLVPQDGLEVASPGSARTPPPYRPIQGVDPWARSSLTDMLKGRRKVDSTIPRDLRFVELEQRAAH